MAEQVPYIVGDIHGCFEEYIRLETKIYRHARDEGWEPHIVCVGDLVDRGPDSAKVVEHFRKGSVSGTHAVVLGNHEVEFIRLLQAFRPDYWPEENSWPYHLYTVQEDFNRNHLGAAQFDSFEAYREILYISWLAQGGAETLLSYECDSERPQDWGMPESHLKFFAEMPLVWENNELVITHALATTADLELVCQSTRARKESAGEDALVLEKHVEAAGNITQEQIREAAVSLIWNRVPPSQKPHPHRMHISGHTPMDHVRVSRGLGFIQLDTGCVYGKRLTSYCLRTDSFLSVESSTSWSRS